MVTRFGNFDADLRTCELFKNGKRRQLPNKAFKLLEFLLERPAQMVTYQEIKERLWADVHVEEGPAVKMVAYYLRRALGPDAHCLENFRGRGYRLNLNGHVHRLKFGGHGYRLHVTVERKKSAWERPRKH